MRFIGCKNNLLDHIKEVIDKHVKEANTFCDLFSGTTTVARHFKQWYSIISNDLLYFSYCLQKGTIVNNQIPSFEILCNHLNIKNPIDYLNSIPTENMEVLPNKNRFFQNNYTPLCNRMYLTEQNALRIDYSRNEIEKWKNQNLINENEYFYLLAAIIEGIPYVSNISGTYGAYNKTWDKRSYKKFELISLNVYDNNKQNFAYNTDGVELLKSISGDILYLDPPYNERQYLPNYHVLETSALYDSPMLNGKTGQRSYGEEQKSKFCSKRTVLNAFEELLKNANFKHIILSYNTEGIMSVNEIQQIMEKYAVPGSFEINYIPYRRFKSKNNSTFTGVLKEMIIYMEKKND